MHGIALPKRGYGNGQEKSGIGSRMAAMAWSHRFFLAIVILPTLLVAAYYYLIASDQYEASADFVVRHAEASPMGGEFGQLLGFNVSGGATQSDAYMVQDYLLSHNAVARLTAQNRLVARFHADNIDVISRLWSANPSPERLLKYYRKHVFVVQDLTTGITRLQVHAFSPQDSYDIASRLLQLGEERINDINRRTNADQVLTAKRELDEATGQLLDVQTRLSRFRSGNADIDPAGTGRAQVTMVTELQANLLQTRAKLHAMAGAVSTDSPQYRALAHQLQAMEAQVAGQSSRIAGADNSVASRLSDYEQLVIKREQVAKTYAAAAVQYEQAKAEGKRKQLYLVRLVEPNMPVKSLFPERWQIVLTVFASLFFAYAIGWLLWAGVREHSL